MNQLYNDTVMDNFLNPKNVGEIENADGIGEVGAAACGDIMKISLKISDDGIIEDAKFRTFGCASAIAASSMATEMIKGKTIEEAAKLTNQDILNKLGGEDYWKNKLPQKIHCSVLAESAIEAALEDYKKKKFKEHSVA